MRRLTETGAFSTVTLREAETPNADGSLDMLLSVTDAKPRRIGFGAEVSSLEGLALSTYWLHRNALGGAERFRIDAEVSDISGETDQIDASLTARLEVPLPWPSGIRTPPPISSSPSPPRTSRPTCPTASSCPPASRGASATSCPARLASGCAIPRSTTTWGYRDFLLFTVPTTLTWDRRDNDLDPRSGWYVDTDLTPFVNLTGAGDGARLYSDMRGYYGFGADKGTVLAGRLQLGSVLASPLEDTQPEYLFYSGGAGSVRGQPYQSLTVDLGDGDETGGRSFLGLSGELRQDIGESFQVVAFADAGFIGSDSAPGGDGNWHSGAGLGLRYKTGIGPLRVDVAGPTSGDTGNGLQLYIGIGQAF